MIIFMFTFLSFLHFEVEEKYVMFASKFISFLPFLALNFHVLKDSM